MSFRDLDEFLTVEPIRLPIRGKTYEFPGAISGEAWLILRKSLRAAAGTDPDAVAITDAQQQVLEDALFGDALDEMVADGLTDAHIKVVFMTLYAHHAQGPELAQMMWESQGEPMAPNRAARRAAARSTRSRGSTAGTTHHSKAGSTGQTSSSTGI